MIDFKSIKAAVNIGDLVKNYGIETNRQGVACCPLHNEKTPSFKVYPKTNSFYCFGCGAGGDVIKFVELMEHVSASDAAKILAANFGLNLCSGKISDEAIKAQIRRKREKEAVKKYEQWEREYVDELIDEKIKLKEKLKLYDVFSDNWCKAQNKVNKIDDILDIFLTSGVDYEYYRAEIYKRRGHYECVV